MRASLRDVRLTEQLEQEGTLEPRFADHLQAALDGVGREGELRRGDMSDDEAEATVERAVRESRGRA